MHPLRQLLSNHSGESRLTRTYVLGIAILYALLIIVLAAALNLSLERGASLVSSVMAAQDREIQRERTELIMERLEAKKPATSAALGLALTEIMGGNRHFAAVVSFGRTADENFFQVVDRIMLDDGLTLPLNPGDVVREEKDNNFLRKGLMDLAQEDRLYVRDGVTWRNIYAPYRMAPRKTMVIQFLVRAGDERETMAAFTASLRPLRLIMMILPVLLVIAVMIITALFLNRLSLLITGLSRYFKKAADGDLAVNLPVTDDLHLGELALSFNSLIEELKDKTDRLDQEESTLLKDIFSRGVSALKENRLDEAIAFFTTLSLVNTGAFGNFFNLGVAYAKKRDYERSLAMFRRAEEANPTHDMTRQYREKIERLAASHAGS